MPFPSPLLPVMDDQERRGRDHQFWQYEKIAEAAAVKVSILPSTHPFAKYLPKGWMQGGRGTCVGFANAIFMQCNYYALTQDYPTADEIAAAAVDQTEKIGSCVMIYDTWYRTVFSAQWCYHISRLVGNVTYPSGSYCSAAAAAMKAVGAIAWDKCLTSKTPYCAPEVYPLSLEECKKLAADHILDGYAKVSTWSGIMDAIATSPSHCIMMPINVYDIPPDSSGNLRLGGNPSGSHALPWLFVDYQNGRIGCWNSWGTDYPQITWIDETYWREAGGPAFVSLDKLEALFAKCLYTKTTVTANTLCSFQVDNDTRPEYVTTFTAMLEAGPEHTITAIPQDTKIARQTKTVKFTNETEATISFTFSTTPGDPVTPGEPWWKALLKKLLEMIRKKRSGDPSGRGN
jgi:hypothetical protein